MTSMQFHAQAKRLENVLVKSVHCSVDREKRQIYYEASKDQACF